MFCSVANGAGEPVLEIFVTTAGSTKLFRVRGYIILARTLTPKQTTQIQLQISFSSKYTISSGLLTRG